MSKITLHGAIPVYVVVDTESQEITHVCASDEEFFYVGENHLTETGDDPRRLSEAHGGQLPLAFTEDGTPITSPEDRDAIQRAVDIAETAGVDWPAWSFGW